MIEIQSLSKRYGETAILENASFTFPDQGLVCVFGPSGCGKSTLLNLIAGFDRDFDGNISVHGTSLSQLDAQALCAYRRDNVGFIFQNYHLLTGYTAEENILLAAEIAGQPLADARRQTSGLLEKFGMADKAGQKIENLSGGQKQRVAIARALVNDPSILLADEPTGALDRKNSTGIMELLKELSASRLVILITHDKKCAEYADRIVTIEDGKLLCGTPAPEASETAGLKQNPVPKLSLWKRAFQNFRVHLPRYLAVALAVSLGVACFALSLSSGNIMEQSIRDFEAKNTAYHNGYIKANGQEDALLDLLTRDERLENIYPQYILRDSSVRIGEVSVGLPEKFPTAKAVQQMSYGVMPRRGEKEIALSPSLAAKFDKNIQNLVGTSAEIAYGGKTWQVTVSGIFNGIFDDYFISSDLEQVMYEGTSEAVYSVTYDVIAFADIPVVSESLLGQNIASQNASAEVSAFLSTFRNLSRLFLTISLLIFAIGLFISTILLVKQQNTRYREVGLLAALGCPRGSIQRMFLYENLLLSGLAVLFSGAFIALISTLGPALGFPLAFSAGEIFGALCLTAALILAISLLSSAKLVRCAPAQALRK